MLQCKLKKSVHLCRRTDWTFTSIYFQSVSPLVLSLPVFLPLSEGFNILSAWRSSPFHRVLDWPGLFQNTVYFCSPPHLHLPLPYRWAFIHLVAVFVFLFLLPHLCPFPELRRKFFCFVVLLLSTNWNISFQETRAASSSSHLLDEELGNVPSSARSDATPSCKVQLQ